MARVVMVLSENWTLISPRDLPTLVDLALVAEAAGVDTVMLSEHVVLGPSAGAAGRMENPRDYAAPGNQDPDTPWPDSIVLAAAIAARTRELRVALAAIIAPLRHPLLLAKQLATLDLLAGGRLVVQPTVSWAAEEYAALGVAFGRRGAILDEQLEAMRAAWTQTPAAFAGAHFRFADVYCEPKPYRPDAPRMWFGCAFPTAKLEPAQPSSRERIPGQIALPCTPAAPSPATNWRRCATKEHRSGPPTRS